MRMKNKNHTITCECHPESTSSQFTEKNKVCEDKDATCAKMSQKKLIYIIRKLTAKDKVIHVEIATSDYQRETRWMVKLG